MSGKKRIKLPAGLFALMGVAAWFVIGVSAGAILKSGGQDIGVKEFAQPVVEQPPVNTDELNMELLKSSMVAADMSELTVDDSLLTVSTSNVPPAKLQPVYNAVFSHSGLQIASLSDSRLKCRSEAIVPFSEMLDAFYSETQLRTLMIKSAYEPYSPPEEKKPAESESASSEAEVPDAAEEQAAPEFIQQCAEHNCGYSFDFGVYIKEDDSRRPFTLEGQYSWFAKHAWEYGFIQRYPVGAEAFTGVQGRDDHFRYVGKLAARIMNSNSLSFEQFMELMKQHTVSDPLVVDDGTVVFLHKLSETKREVPVPKTAEGELVPCEVYYFGKGQKNVLVAVKPTAEFYTAAAPQDTAQAAGNGEQT